MQSDTVAENSEIFSVETQLHQNGAVYRKTPIDIKGASHGLEQFFRDSGKLWSQHPWQHGILHGTEEFYNENGDMFHSVTYENGVAQPTVLHNTL